MINVLVIFWICATVASIFVNRHFSLKVAKLANKYVESVNADFLSISKSMVAVLDATKTLSTIVCAAAPSLATVGPKDGIARFYSVLLERGIERRLFICPAQTLEEVILITTKEFGPGWAIVTSAHADVSALALAAPHAVAPEVPNEIDPLMKDVGNPKVRDFISYLEYSKEKFASEEAQKSALDSIINNIKKLYGRSHSGSAT